MGILDSLLSLVPTVGNFISQAATNQKNLNLQKTEWAREDTAMQRKVADLKAAGLNPVLAAEGAGSPTSLAVKMSAPEVDNNAFNNALQARVVRNQIGRTAADTKIAESNARLADTNATVNSLTLPDQVAQIRAASEKMGNDAVKSVFDRAKSMEDALAAEQYRKQSEIDTVVKAHDWNIIKETGVLSNVGGTTGNLINTSALVRSAISALEARGIKIFKEK